MNKRISIFCLVLGLALASCKKDPEPAERRLPATLCVQVNPDNVPSTDSLLIFDNCSKAVVFETFEESFYKKVYFTSSWTGDRPAYGLHMGIEAKPVLSEGGIISTCIPEVQESGKSYDIMGGTVTENNGNFMLDLRDARAFLCFNANVDFVAGLTLEAPGGEMLGGDIDVSLDSLSRDSTAFWAASKGGKTYSSLALVPSAGDMENGCFKEGLYSLSLLPQTYSQGLKVKMFDIEGKIICSKIFGSSAGLIVGRNESYVIEYEKPDTRPDTIRIKMDFYNEDDVNPLGFDSPGSKYEDATAGETYYFDYRYEYEGQPMSEQIPFVVCKGAVAGGEYKYYAASDMVYGEQGKKILNFVKDNWWIKLPAIEGRYLKAVTVSHGNSYNKRCYIYTGPGTGKVCSYTSNSSQAIATSEHLNVETMSFPNDLQYAAVHSTQLNTAYYLYGKGAAAIRIYHLEIVYTKTL